MVRSNTPTARKPRKNKWNNVGIPPEADAELEKICDFRGWNKKTAVVRMIKRELAEITGHAPMTHVPA